ncbi:MAG: acyl carrier protein [Chloroflexaceae bacterium]|jgi:acyl carrier protein|nr:acyl carrier protein [Chloroflexaceae bacterium]
MSPDTIKPQFREFLGKVIRNHDLKDDDDIFAQGFVNSLFAMQLVMFTENTFALAVEDEDLTLDNFRTINAMTALVLRKKA